MGNITDGVCPRHRYRGRERCSMSKSPPRAILPLVLALLTATLLGMNGGRPAWDTPHAAAQSPISPADEDWIETASVRADLDGDAQRARLVSCLRVRLGSGVDRFRALPDC